MSRSTPSSRSYLVRVPGVLEAGGVLRDTLGSLRNLDQLVRSMRVGPKGLERAIPDVHSACSPALDAVQVLARLLTQALDSSPVAERVSTYVSDGLGQAATALGRASEQPMTAKNRLALEQALGRLLPDLDAGRDLLELLVEAVWAPAVVSPLREQLCVGQRPLSHSPDEAVRVGIADALADVEVRLPPAVTQGCFGLLASAFQARHGRGPVLQARPRGEELWVELNASDVPGTHLLLPRQPVAPPSLEVVQLALATWGCRVDLVDFPRISLPPTDAAALDSTSA